VPSARAWKVKLSCDGRSACALPRGWLGARDAMTCRGCAEGDVRENVPLVARCRARLGSCVPLVAGLGCVGCVRRTAGDNHPVGVRSRRDLVRGSVPELPLRQCLSHARNVAGRSCQVTGAVLRAAAAASGCADRPARARSPAPRAPPFEACSDSGGPGRCAARAEDAFALPGSETSEEPSLVTIVHSEGTDSPGDIPDGRALGQAGRRGEVRRARASPAGA